MNSIVEELLNRLDEDQREEYEERAAIMQYDGKMTRELAEANAMICLLKKYPDVLRENNHLI